MKRSKSTTDHARAMGRSPTVREAVRRACLRAALDAFEDARIRGLCCEGAWECAIGAIRQLNLDGNMGISVKRIYEPPGEDDGCRVLVDRIWPRGKSKDELKIDRWMKSVAPSTLLRRWFSHDPRKWDGFRKRYFQELDQRRDELRGLLEETGERPLTLLFSAKDEHHNNAVALREYLNRLKRR